MNTILKIAAATLALGFATAAEAQDVKPFAGVVIVPASAPATLQQPLAPSPLATQPTFKRAEIVTYGTDKKPGSVIVDTINNRLYYILGMDRAAMYRIASGKPGFEWAGVHKVSAKAEWPSWTPPAEMRVRRPELPAHMAGGPNNPLGARAMYLGSSLYRIHGTNEPQSIGKAASSGCIRMLNDDVTELYQFVKLGAEVTVM